ncbi:polysaccharide biosynthesis/export family protein [Lacibacter sediminis]|uniref:Polysaccharide biosynthesis/export family protein n=1 Tax=Lacibacter sediminis TaxID=2760713 RepID=A0A7G5XHL9_9BACT|nr:polysaccharide biosynthesis/export family protein [Lacibacter sediminis]QNA44972.1 polysaccharide biosynthesis/export family protein [Lacibacter sediminis]
MIRLLSLSTAVCLLFLSSCVSPAKLRKEVVYFNEGLDTAKLNQYKLVEPIIQKGDLLQINIASRSSSANQLFSQNYSGASTGSGASSSSGSGGGVGASGYLVDITTGDIKLPLLGIIHADGMTKLELEREIVKRASEYLKEDPIVNIRYQNFRVTFHGLVGKPGEVTSTSERLTFLDALALAGGIAPGGDLKTILIIREQNGKRSMQTVDLTKGDFFQSPNYYLKQNDIVYVKPTDRQLKVTDQTTQRTLQYVSFGLSLVNIIIVLSSIFR